MRPSDCTCVFTCTCEPVDSVECMQCHVKLTEITFEHHECEHEECDEDEE